MESKNKVKELDKKLRSLNNKFIINEDEQNRILNKLNREIDQQKSSGFMHKKSWPLSYYMSLVGAVIICFLLVSPQLIKILDNGSIDSNNQNQIINESETFLTILPENWSLMDLDQGPNTLVFSNQENTISIQVSEELNYTIIDDEPTKRNILLENFEQSNNFDEFLDKMIQHESNNGELVYTEIDEVNTTPIFSFEYDDYFFISSYLVVNNKPFYINIQVHDDDYSLEKLMDSSEYELFKKVINSTQPI
ncbi:hypothetical protein ACERII_23825 [Evansella sp. AB-rgal1]|uniref:hypothetical protein n=1 Tax=Evansella sp. AB-rgal1 TaxID=3242696 RepID=UPI00359ED1BB